jgi:DNA-binding NtrC family response regulator
MADVLVVDDDQLICDLLTNVIGKLGHRVNYAQGSGQHSMKLRQDRMTWCFWTSICLTAAG